MSLGSYLKSHLKIPSGGIKGIASNLLKDVAPVAGALTGGLGGIAIGGLGSALGQATSRHPSFGAALKSGITGGAEAYGGSKLLDIARGGGLATAGSAPSVTTGASTAATPSWTATAAASPIATGTEAADSVGSGAASLGSGAALGGSTSSALASAPGLATRALDFAEAHPNATSGVLNAVGAIPGQNTEARLRNAQASTLEQQANESAYDFAQRKRREELLAPVWSALGTSATDGYSKVAPNPYSQVS